MIIEGPIITVIGAFLASLGFFNIGIIFFLSLLGDIVGDIILADNTRKSTQAELDRQLAELNNLSRQIGALMKDGKTYLGHYSCIQ